MKKLIILLCLLACLSCNKNNGTHITNKDLKYRWTMSVIYKDSLGGFWRSNITTYSTANESAEEIAKEVAENALIYSKHKWIAILSIEKEKP